MNIAEAEMEKPKTSEGTGTPAAYVPLTDEERREMLAAIGVASVRELLKGMPQGLLEPKLKLPRALTEMELSAHVKGLGKKNLSPVCFMGGGAYEHHIPAAVWALTLRGEFATAYTPYQPEASQGTLQAIYEFQSMVAELYGMDVANASLYDGASALAEAVNAALKHTGRKKALLARSVHPHYRKTVQTYFESHPDYEIEELPSPNGVFEPLHLRAALTEDVGCVVLQSPNFFGCLEDLEAAAEAAHAKGALLVAACEPVSLGVLKSPGEQGVDISVGEGQGLGLPLGYGGPYLGLYACKKELLRTIPGRLCGRTLDKEAKPGFVLTLQAREQHIRRERASSNVCTNTALCALAATIHLTLLGPAGLREACDLSYRNAHSLAEKVTRIPGFKLRFDAPFFNEFVVESRQDPLKLQSALLKEGLLVGPALASDYAEHRNALLLCATETRTDEEIDKLVSALRRLA